MSLLSAFRQALLPSAVILACSARIGTLETAAKTPDAGSEVNPDGGPQNLLCPEATFNPCDYGSVILGEAQAQAQAYTPENINTTLRRLNITLPPSIPVTFIHGNVQTSSCESLTRIAVNTPVRVIESFMNNEAVVYILTRNQQLNGSLAPAIFFTYRRDPSTNQFVIRNETDVKLLEHLYDPRLMEIIPGGYVSPYTCDRVPTVGITGPRYLLWNGTCTFREDNYVTLPGTQFSGTLRIGREGCPGL